MTSSSFDCLVYAAIRGKEKPTLPLQGEWLYLGYEVVPVQLPGEEMESSSIILVDQGTPANSDDNCTSSAGIKSRALNLDFGTSEEVHCLVSVDEEVRMKSPNTNIRAPLNNPQQENQDSQSQNKSNREIEASKSYDEVFPAATTCNNNCVGKMNDTNKYHASSDRKIPQQTFADTKNTRQRAKTKNCNARRKTPRLESSAFQAEENINKQALTTRYNPEIKVETSSYDSIFSFCEFGVFFVVIRYLFLQGC